MYMHIMLVRAKILSADLVYKTVHVQRMIAVATRRLLTVFQRPLNLSCEKTLHATHQHESSGNYYNS